MTSLESIFSINPDALEIICLCILHYGLRMFAFLMKLGYHQTFKHNTKLEIFIPEFEENKAKIQKAFYEEKGLRIDQVRSTGGSTTDGNVSLLSEFSHLYLELIYVA